MADPTAAPISLRARRQMETRDAITSAAWSLFEAQGYTATTVDEISREAGISTRTFFRYFPTKEDVLLGWLNAIDSFLQTIPLPTTNPVDLQRHLEKVILHHLETMFSSTSGSPLTQQYRRLQRLLNADTDLHHVALVWQDRIRFAAHDRLCDHLEGHVSELYIALLVEHIAGPLVAALDTWGREGMSDDLPQLYREACVLRTQLHEGARTP